jgi:hypothetical protein
VAAVVEVQRGWCSSRGGWKMRVGIGVGDGGGAHNAFYRTEEGVRRGVSGGGMVAGGKCDFNGHHFGK